MIDTETKRRSAMSSPTYLIGPVPDGSLDGNDIEHIAGYYVGLLHTRCKFKLVCSNDSPFMLKPSNAQAFTIKAANAHCFKLKAGN